MRRHWLLINLSLLALGLFVTGRGAYSWLRPMEQGEAAVSGSGPALFFVVVAALVLVLLVVWLLIFLVKRP